MEHRDNLVESRRREAGFTLPEVLITIVVLGILLAIAVPVWNGVVESRRVDSATNQFASDLRLANSRATNQLNDWSVVYADGNSSYQLVPDGGSAITRTLPDGTEVIGSTVNANGGSKVLEFKPQGIVDDPNDATDPSEYTITIGSENGSRTSDISVNAATSRVEIVG